MQTKHTPGPWVLITDGPARIGFEVRQESSGVLLAETRMKTDAALIGAAPEMLAALELVLNDNRLMSAMNREQSRAILDVIKKAKAE